MSGIDWDTPEIAGHYDQNCDHQFEKGRILIGMMGIDKGDTVLDVGCGTGRMAVHVAGIIGPYGRIMGIDPSSHRIALAQAKFSQLPKGNSGFLVGQAENMSAVATGSVGFAYFCSSFHWIDDKKSALTEVLRVLKPGGTVGMTTRDKGSPDTMRDINDTILSRHNLPRGTAHTGGMKRVTAQELSGLLTDAGFTGVSVEPRVITRHYGSPDEIIRHYDKRGRLRGITDNLPDDMKETIRTEIAEELKRRQHSGLTGSGNVTLYARALKPCART